MPTEPTVRLRCKVGPYAGQTIEYPKSVAENLLATGQAELPDGETPDVSAPPAPEKATRPKPQRRARATSTTKKKAKKKR